MIAVDPPLYPVWPHRLLAPCEASTPCACLRAELWLPHVVGILRADLALPLSLWGTPDRSD